MLTKLPWLTVSGETNRLTLHHPYGQTLQAIGKLNVVTILEYDSRDSNFEVQTMLKRHTTMYNNVNLGGGCPFDRSSCSLQGDKAIPGGAEIFMCRLCMTVSDVICIKARNFRDVAKIMFKLIDSQDPGHSKDAWPDFVILLSAGSTCTRSIPIDVELEQYLIQQWRKSLRTNGRYHTLFQIFLKKMKVHVDWNIDKECIVQLPKPCHELRDIVSIVENFYLNYNPPLAYRERAQYWPGVFSRDYNNLKEWFRLLDGTTERRVELVSELAELFVQDARMVVQDSEFTTEELFISFYKPLCIQAWEKIFQGLKCRKDEDLELFLEDILDRIMLSTTPSVRSGKTIRAIANNSTCPCCIWNLKPLVLLECGHSICERDAWRYSWRKSALHSLSRFNSCPVCSARSQVVVRLRPLQAGFRIATFDGGGVRGIVSICSLVELFRGLPEGIQLYHVVDVVGGCSSGSINGTFLMIEKLPLHIYLDLFCKLSVTIFYKKNGLWAVGRRFVRLFKKGAMYDNTVLYDELRKACGERKMRGTGSSNVPDIGRVFIVIADLKGNTIIARSYGETTLEGMLADDPEVHDGPLETLWQVLAYSCLAPLYYAEDNGYWDGGVTGINNSQSAMREVNRLSVPGGLDLDFEASFGTGTFSESHQQGVTSWLPEWSRRMLYCLDKRIGATQQYNLHHDALPLREQRKCYRIDPCLQLPVVSLDDYKSIEKLMRSTKDWYSKEENLQGIQNLQQKILATAFYAVLLEKPSIDSTTGIVSAKIAIACRWEDDDDLKSNLYKMLSESFFYVESLRSDLDTVRFPVGPGLSFTVKTKNLDDKMDIKLDNGKKKMNSISGFPASIAKIRTMQVPDLDSYKGNKRQASESLESPEKRIRLAQNARRLRLDDHATYQSAQPSLNTPLGLAEAKRVETVCTEAVTSSEKMVRHGLHNTLDLVSTKRAIGTMLVVGGMALGLRRTRRPRVSTKRVGDVNNGDQG